MKTLMAKTVGVFLVLGLCFSLGYSYRDGRAQTEALQAELKAAHQAETHRNELQEKLNVLSTHWQQSTAVAEKTAKRTIDDLRADGVRLRVRLAEVSATAASSDRPDTHATAELHPADAQFFIGESQRCDRQITHLQGVIKLLQGGTNAPKED